MLKAGWSAQGDDRYVGCARGRSGAGQGWRLSLMSVAVAALFPGVKGAHAADINNITPFANNGPFFGNVISNSSSIDNNTPGSWNGNIQSNDSFIGNNAGATWNGGIASNRSEIDNYGTWVNGNITSNGNPADPLPANLGSNGFIYNAAGATWNGNVNGNSDFILNDGGAWNGNINGNANYVLNNGGVWTGNIVGNGGFGSQTQVVNGGNGLWVGDVQGNTGVVANDGAWQGSVLSNSRTVQNSGSWTGDVAGNSFNVYNFTGVWTGDVTGNGGTIFNMSTTVIAVWNGTVRANSGSILNQADSRWNGDVAGNAGTIINSATWTGNVTGNAGTITNNATWNGTVANAGTFTNSAGAMVSGIVTNSGTANNAGTLVGGLINSAGITNNIGSIAGITTVSGGTLTGNGTIANLTVGNGGTFAPGSGTPGTFAIVTNNVTFELGAFYSIALNPSTASFARVAGSAALGGATVQAIFASASYVAKQYSILTAAGGLGASTFGSQANTNLPSGFKTALSYDPTHAYLDLSLIFVSPPGSGLSGNQQNVANTIVNFFNRNGSIPIVFGALTPTGLTQVSGETAVGSQQTTFNAMSQFMGVMTDPFMAGRGDGMSAGGTAASGYASTQKTGAARDAYAMFTKAPPVAPFEQRWSTWIAGYGGSQSTDGNTALGSNNTTSSVYGTAVGADYRFSPDTIAGFSLAGGGTNFSVANGGSGRSDLFQAGAFIRHNVGAAYIAAAAAYGWQDITTDRTVTVAGIDRLHAEFNANAWSGRLEGGYRFVSPWVGGIGITPYAAGQFTTFELPAYAEQALVGSNNFVLGYGSKSVTDSRSELGLRTDKSWAMQGAILTLRGRAAWAHDYNPDRSIGATFQTLPGASFVINGAPQAADSALVTASAETKWMNGWSTAATFEGEFSNVTRSYAGKGVVRYAW
jgi:uncharacterized protein with beta-barrel porin domain